MDTQTLVRTLAKTLDDAMLEAREIERLTLTHPDLSLEDAYVVQDHGIRLRLGRGERQIGLKMGLTSKAKMEQMGLHSSIYGVLTDRMQVMDGGTFSLKGAIHPKIEPEIGFIVGREIRGKITAQEAWEVCSSVFGALEILDSRFLNFKYFSLPDVVADNCSSSYFVISKIHEKPAGLRIYDLTMTMKINGVAAQTAKSSEILGNPLESLVMLCELLNSRGSYLPAGSIVLAGAATVAVALEPGMQVSIEVEGLSGASVSVV